MGVDAGEGLAAAEVERRLAEYGPNELPTEPPPRTWVVAREQLMNPMNIMLLIVVAASFAIVQVELNMLQRLLDTTSLSGREWIIVLALSLLAPAVVAADKAIQLRRQNKAPIGGSAELKAGPAVQAST
jgi:Ca2+-transporting ATPase